MKGSVFVGLLAVITAAEVLRGVRPAPGNADIPLTVSQTLRINLEFNWTYTITVDTSSALEDEYSSFSLQIHTQLYNVSLTNASEYCLNTRDIECSVHGSNVGLVQVWNGSVAVFPFHVRIECDQVGLCSGDPVAVLIAVVGVPVEDPVPGGCTLTSNLIIDPNLAISYTSYSTEVQFQDSDVGFRPSNESYPVCDVPDISSETPLQHLDYTVYQKCVGRYQFSVSALMDAIEDMLSVSLSEKQEYSYSTLEYNDIKRIEFASISGQGVVYNVIVTDKRTGAKSAYVPIVTYACDIHSQSCHEDIPAVNAVIGVILLLLGLALCLVGHIFFHAEVLIFHLVGGCYLWFMIFSISTSFDHSLLAGLSLLFGILYSLIWFLIWFLTGWHWIQVITFGLYADFVITASLLYSPLEDTSIFTVLQISYVYYLVIMCGMILFMVPIVAFPRALSIWTSSLVGSYTFIIGVGMFKYTELSEIVLLVVKKFSVHSLYSAHIDCPLQTTDYILVAVWVLLLIAGLTIQTTVIQLRRRKHKRRQLVLSRNMRKKYNSFPHPSLLKKLLQYRKRKCPEGEPLLTPNHSHSPTHSQWSPVHSTKLPSNGRWSPGNSPVYPSNYGTTGATVNEPAYRRF